MRYSKEKNKGFILRVRANFEYIRQEFFWSLFGNQNIKIKKARSKDQDSKQDKAKAPRITYNDDLTPMSTFDKTGVVSFNENRYKNERFKKFGKRNNKKFFETPRGSTDNGKLKQKL